MNKNFKRFLTGSVIAVVFMFAAAAVFISIRVDNRVRIETVPPPFTNNHPVVRLDSSVLPPDSVSSFITSLMEKAGVHGMGTSIINNHQLVYQQYFGVKDNKTREALKAGAVFQGASFSKTIFADIVVQLAEDNVLHLDTPLYKYLPKPLYSYKTNALMEFLGALPVDYTGLKNDYRHKKITARMCLSHTTGFPNWRWFEPDGELRIKHDPGTRYFYSGEGMYLLQFVIEELTGRSYEEIAVEKVFKPLAMNQSSYVWQQTYETTFPTAHDPDGNSHRIPKRNYSNAAASLSTSLEDFTTFMMHVLAQKEKRHEELIRPQVSISSKQQFGPNALIDTHENDAIQLSYGLGFGLYETPYGKAFFKEGHNDGWQHYTVGFPSRGTALIMMSNSDNAEGIFKYLIEFCLANPYTPWYWEGYFPFDRKSTVDISK